MAEILVPKGSLIKCRSCGQYVLEAVQDIKRREVMAHTMFRSLQGLKLTYQMIIKCVKCGDDGKTTTGSTGNYFSQSKNWERPDVII